MSVLTYSSSSSLPGSEQLIPSSILIDDKGRFDHAGRQQNNTPLVEKTSIDNVPQGNISTRTQSSAHSRTVSPVLSEQHEDDHHLERTNSSSDLTHRSRTLSSEKNGLTINTNLPFTNQLINNSSEEKKTNLLSSIQPQYSHEERLSSPSSGQPWSLDNQVNGNIGTNHQANHNHSLLTTAAPVSSWENPYWKGTTTPETSIQLTSVGNNADTNDTKSPNATTTASSQQNKPWENLYGKDKGIQALTSAGNVPSSLTSISSANQDQPWANPYWKDQKSQPPTSPNNQVTSQNKPQQDQPWANPYWKDQKSQPSTSPNTQATSQNKPQQDQPWANPYWKDQKSQPPTSPNTQVTSQNKPQQDQPWANPYWKDQKSQSSTSPNTQVTSQNKPQQDQPWANPYWKDQKSQSATSSTNQVTSQNKPQQDQSWANPYWKDKASQGQSNGQHKQPSSSTTSAQQDKSWANPYWKDQKSQPATSSTNQVTSQSKPQQDQPWANPYWKDQKSQPSTSPNTQVTSQNKPQQDQPWANPYWKDKASQGQSNGQHKQPSNSTTSAHQDKPWENPYWGDKPFPSWKSSNGSNNAPPTTSTTTQDKPWENPYWKGKSSQAPTSSAQAAATSDRKSSLPKQPDQPWVNPYWKDAQTQGTNQQQGGNRLSTLSNSFQPIQQNNNQNPMYSFIKDDESSMPRRKSNSISKGGLWNSNQTSPSEHNAPPIPPFFQRIYPSPSSSSISKVPSTTKTNAMNLNQTSAPKPYPTPSNNFKPLQPISDDEEPLPFTIDNRGVAHFQTDSFFSSSSANRPKESNSVPQSTTSQYQFVNPPSTVNALVQPPTNSVPPRVISNIVSPSAAPSSTPMTNNKPSSSSKLLPSMSFINNLTSSPSVVVITEQEVNDIHSALHKLEQNPNSIPTIQPSQSTFKPSNPNPNTGYTTLNSLVTNNQQQTPNQQRSTLPTPSIQAQIHNSPYNPIYNPSQNPPNIISTLPMSNPLHPNNNFDYPVQPKPVVHI